MRNYCPLKRLAVVAALSLSFVGCQQSDQQLPFDLAPGEGATSQIGPAGGVVSLPPSFSLEIPANALASATAVDVSKLISEPFPGDAGVPVPGAAYDVGPAGTTLSAPAVVRIKVDPALIEAGTEALLSVAVRGGDGTVRTYGGTFDLTNGTLVAEVDELGPMAAVVTLDAIAVLAGLPDSLPGGSFPLPPAPAPTPVGAAPAPSYGGVLFTASCSPSERQCFSSGVIRVWADDVVTERLGEDLFLVDGSVDVELEFFDFVGGVPSSAVGSLNVTGDLRARFNSTIATYDLAESSTTGETTDAVPTSLRFESGNVMVFGLTTSISGDIIEPNFDDAANFGIDGIGTSEMLILRVETELEFENSDGTFDYGLIVAYLRLRR
jgi:hypothetical protein